MNECVRACLHRSMTHGGRLSEQNQRIEKIMSHTPHTSILELNLEHLKPILLTMFGILIFSNDFRLVELTLVLWWSSGSCLI